MAPNRLAVLLADSNEASLTPAPMRALPMPSDFIAKLAFICAPRWAISPVRHNASIPIPLYRVNRKEKMRKLAWVMATLAVAAALAGCGHPTESPETIGAAYAEDPEEAAATYQGNIYELEASNLTLHADNATQDLRHTNLSHIIYVLGYRYADELREKGATEATLTCKVVGTEEVTTVGSTRRTYNTLVFDCEP